MDSLKENARTLLEINRALMDAVGQLSSRGAAIARAVRQSRSQWLSAKARMEWLHRISSLKEDPGAYRPAPSRGNGREWRRSGRADTEDASPRTRPRHSPLSGIIRHLEARQLAVLQAIEELVSEWASAQELIEQLEEEPPPAADLVEWFGAEQYPFAYADLMEALEEEDELPPAADLIKQFELGSLPLADLEETFQYRLRGDWIAQFEAGILTAKDIREHWRFRPTFLEDAEEGLESELAFLHKIRHRLQKERARFEVVKDAWWSIVEMMDQDTLRWGVQARALYSLQDRQSSVADAGADYLMPDWSAAAEEEASLEKTMGRLAVRGPSREDALQPLLSGWSALEEMMKMWALEWAAVEEQLGQLRTEWLSTQALVERMLEEAGLGREAPGEINLYRADMSGAVLGGADFSGACMFGADLSAAVLHRACLAGADLTEANLRGADLSEANLSRTRLNRADLGEANLQGAHLEESSLHEAQLCGANLFRTDLRGADLYNADLSGTHLSGVDWHGARLCETDLRGTNLFSANLDGVDLRGADLREADLRRANLERAQLQGALYNEGTKFPEGLNREARGLLKA